MKIVYLDGLRGTAAFIVVVAHFFQVFMPSVFEGKKEIEHFAFEGLAARTPMNLIFNGNFSVCLFFVLSGYVLSCKFFKTKNNSVILSSAIRRYFRLAAPAFFSVILAYLIMIMGLGAFDNIREITLSSMPDPFAADARLLTMLQESLFYTFFTYGSGYNPVLWTMTYELFGSFLIFAFLLTLGRRNIRFAGYAILFYWFIDSYYLGFILGMLLSDLKNSERDWLAYINKPWINFFMLITGGFMGSFPYINPQGTMYSFLVWESSDFSFFVFYHVIGSSLIITALLNSRRMQSLFSLKLFAYLGKVSFSLYLVHFTIICSFGSFIFLMLSPYLAYSLNVILTITITLPVIFAIAHLFYRFIDAKTLYWLARWTDQLFNANKSTRRDLPM
ncbi:acyltransferase family protein [Paenibacillus dakarensis]|uniref:acyltransferase family protein n=1 Tax=Paenibacillus dakarensis TaxID=1527293 RepID=UPI0006D593BC|nr:acyltransferase [Paenibacillus dakarensis]